MPARPTPKRPLSRLMLALLALVAAAPAAARPAHGADAPRLDAAAWRADLAEFAAALRRLHPDPFAMVAEARFDSAVQALERRIPELDDTAIATGFLALSALIEDGHSGAIALLPPFGFTSFFPLRLTVEDGALYVVAAPAAQAALVGGRVVRFGRVGADEALARTLTVCSGDNDFSRLDRVPLFMMSPGVMHALGIVDRDAPLQVVVEPPAREGRKPRPVSTTLAAAPPGDRFPAFFQDPYGLPVADGVTLRSASGAPPPLHLSRPDRAWWFEPIPGRDLVYVQFRRVDREDGGVTFAAFVDSLFAYVDAHRVGHLVIDLRHNGGGDNTILQPLIHGLIRRDRTVNRPGHLYAIIGRETFSAAMNCANWIEEHTHATFVGEPTGARPNHFGDATTVRLTRSGMPVRISRYRWSARLPWDDRPWIAPHLAAPPSVALERAGRDPALEAIFGELGRAPLAERLRALLEAGRADEARAACRAHHERFPDRWGRSSLTETIALARALFDEGKPDAALTLARINTEVFPGAARAWTTLGIGYVVTGRPAAAIAPLEKALALDPQDTSARRWLERATEAAR